MKTTSENNSSDYLRVMQYVNDNKQDYDHFEIQEILDYAKECDLETIAKTDLVREIYDELGLIPDNLNIYRSFIDVMNDTFGIHGKQICEVGGGIIPRLAKRIHLQQKTGSITVYDPRLSQRIQGEDRFHIKREFFYESTPVEDVDLLVGLMPCEGANPLIDSALRHQKDFIIWLCEGGPHGDYFDYFESDEEWLDSTLYRVERSVEKNQMGKMKILMLPDFSEYPIIYNER